MDHISQIKARLPIEGVVGTYIKLERAGSNFRAICPFHKEKTPSFNVSPARDAYYCFGCAKGGDIFNFVQEIEGLTFPEALRILANKAGVELPERSLGMLDNKKEEKDRLIELMEASTNIFAAHLEKNTEVKQYLYNRGLTDETIGTFRIGFAPLEWRLLFDALKQKGFSDGELERSRVVKKVEGKGYYDTFRGRIMFPIMDSSGRVIAFTGRVFGDQRANDGTPIAKYLNSPEGELYDKSSVLFGYDRAKIAIRKSDHVVIVEGQMDCIMSHQAGVDQTVAISGTALTMPQISLLKRLTNKIILALDTDNAGINATLRSAKLALSEDMQVKVAMVPNGKDPADYILSHGDNWQDVLTEAEAVIPYLLKLYSKLGLHGEPLRERIQKEIFPLINALLSKIAQAQMVTEIARVLSVREIDVWDDIKRVLETSKIENQYSNDVNNEIDTTTTQKVVVSPRIMAEKEIIGLLLWQETSESPSFNTSNVRDTLNKLYEEYGLVQAEIDNVEETKLLMIAESKYVSGASLEEISNDLIDRIEKEMIAEVCSTIMGEIRMADNKGEDASDLIRKLGVYRQKQRRLEDRFISRPTIFK